MPFIQFSYGLREGVRAGLEHWTPAIDPAPIAPLFRDYALGSLYVATDKVDNAIRVADRLAAARSDSPALRDLGAGFAHSIRARIALRQRNWPDALAEVEKAIVIRPGLDLVGDVPFFAFEAERFTHGDALYQLGRYEEALRWYGAFGEHSPYGRVYRPLAYRRMASIYDKLGRKEEAIAAYERFIAAWKDCDPEMKQFVEDARARVVGLRTAVR
jgi:tetratricopeptide (TPR) repeat protein